MNYPEGLFLKREWNGSTPVNSFELQNEPHWVVHCFSFFIYCFCLKSTKTLVVKKWLFDRKVFIFLKRFKRDKYCWKLFFKSQNQPHSADLCFSGVLKHFCLNLMKKTFISVQKVTLSENGYELHRNDFWTQTSVKRVKSYWELIWNSNWATLDSSYIFVFCFIFVGNRPKQPFWSK